MTNPNQTLLRAANQCLLAAALAAALTRLAPGQQGVEGQPYGQPSECFPGGSTSLGLYLVQVDGAPALRLEGGTPLAPALLLLGPASGAAGVAGGGVRLVEPVAAIASGRFDARGVYLHPLTDVALAGGALFVQGVQPPTTCAGMELSGGLRLVPRLPARAPVDASPRPPEHILVEEFAAMMAAGHLEAALDLALNSKGDQLSLEFNGNLEVPIVVVPGVTAGGKAAFKAGIQRGEDSHGNTVYDVLIGADVAASAGVGVGAGGLGASRGQGVEIVWRYQSAHEVARALRSMAILQAVGPRLELLCLALDSQLENMDRAVDFVRNTVDRARTFVRGHMPWRDDARVRRLQSQLDAQRAQRRQVIDRARRVVAQLIGWVADERIFLTVHLHGYEQHSTMAAELSIGSGFGDKKAGGEVSGANFGASAALGVEQQFGVRVERVEESGATAVEHKTVMTRSMAASAGCCVGVAAATKRVLELTRRLQFDADGVELSDSGTTVKLALDGKLLGALGAIVAGQAGVGGEFTLQMRLADLLRFGHDVIDILLGDDSDKIADVLRALPIELEARGRYEAGIALGFGIDVDGVFKGGFGGSATMVDRGVGFTYRGGQGGSVDRGETLPHMVFDAVTAALRQGPIQRTRTAFESELHAVLGEVAHVCQQR